MKHAIRINGKVQQFDCQLASGVLDKNGVEIFEGDIIQICDWEERLVVEYFDGAFWFVNSQMTCGINAFFDDELEVVGHIAQD